MAGYVAILTGRLLFSSLPRGSWKPPRFGNLGCQPDSEVVEKVLSDLAGH